jgi:hypothetical protein
MVDAVLRRLTSDDLEKYVTLLGALLAEEAASSRGPDKS